MTFELNNSVLVIGVPGEDIDGATDAGAIQLLYSNASGPSTNDSHFFHQTDFGLTVETGDQFGFAVLADDFNRDGFADPLVSAPFEDDDTTVDSGVVNGKLGSATGIVDPARHLWTWIHRKPTPLTAGEFLQWR